MSAGEGGTDGVAVAEPPRLRVPLAAVVLTALFVAALVTAQVISAKLLAVSLPVLGAVTAPGGTLAYAVTFFASDCLSELYGKEYARKVVNVAFVMNFVLLALVFATIAVPAAEGSVDPAAFETVLGLSGNVVIGSLAAYVLSQNWDVIAFHRIRELTDGDALWLRNVGSTATSQLIDTVVFTLVAFAVAPAVFGVGVALPSSVLASLIVGQYVLKLLIALVDTPLVYAAVAVVRRDEADTAGVSV
ncbi:queuosine precursor transporter [Halobaculum sp. CBA1158]|uniref:queuosine precursor transporter n=1 Tax=Halobaculum sp. CBA1158 TaxID=2904243 RepID=UPI001F20D741|nr:queuosine precursor transporter [Halobaculum sp. CBA1158]UIO99865.1 queuosine precursor transporter [Halobaculum sp. CBA1158]